MKLKNWQIAGGIALSLSLGLISCEKKQKEAPTKNLAAKTKQTKAPLKPKGNQVPTASPEELARRPENNPDLKKYGAPNKASFIAQFERATKFKNEEMLLALFYQTKDRNLGIRPDTKALFASKKTKAKLVPLPKNFSPTTTVSNVTFELVPYPKGYIQVDTGVGMPYSIYKGRYYLSTIERKK